MRKFKLVLNYTKLRDDQMIINLLPFLLFIYYLVLERRVEKGAVVKNCEVNQLLAGVQRDRRCCHPTVTVFSGLSVSETLYQVAIFLSLKFS